MAVNFKIRNRHRLSRNNKIPFAFFCFQSKLKDQPPPTTLSTPETVTRHGLGFAKAYSVFFLLRLETCQPTTIYTEIYLHFFMCCL